MWIFDVHSGCDGRVPEEFGHLNQFGSIAEKDACEGMAKIVEPTDALTSGDIINPESFEIMEINYLGLNDDRLLNRVENLVYTEALRSLDSDKYVLENVQAVFISKEYIDEVMFNSQTNVYFGYTLDELNDIFQGTRYVFTLGDDGQTTVQPFEEIEIPHGQRLDPA